MEVTTNLRISTGAAVMHMSEDICLKLYLMAMRITTLILRFRDFYILISCLNTRDNIHRNAFRKKQLENRRLKDQKPVIEAFLQWLDRLSTIKGSDLTELSLIVKIKGRI